MPKHAELPLVFPDLLGSFNRSVYTEELMVFRQQLRRLALRFAVQGEVLGEVEQPRRFADSSDHRLQTDEPLLALVIDLFPLSKMLPAGCHAADSTFRAVREVIKPLCQKICGIVVR
jgi:hypothetical protein